MSNFPILSKQVTIQAGQSQSSGTYIGDGEVTGLIIPAGWTTAKISFLGSLDGATYQTLYDTTGANIQYTVAGGTQVSIPEDVIRGCTWLAVLSGTAAAPVPQGSTVIVTIQVQKRAQYMPR